MEKAERVLGKVETALRPTEDSRPETITDEERFMFRKLGLRMKAFLLLGNSLSYSFLCWTFAQLLGTGHICPITFLVCCYLRLPLFNLHFLFLVADEQRY
jgi:hypothetical protein